MGDVTYNLYVGEAYLSWHESMTAVVVTTLKTTTIVTTVVKTHDSGQVACDDL